MDREFADVDEELPPAEAWIENKQGEWVLSINRVATEEDREKSQYLEKSGDTVEIVAITVLYCPYCGEQLNESRADLIPAFRHFDFSKGWR